MYGKSPFMLNGFNIFSQLFSNVFLDGAINQMLSSGLDDDTIEEEPCEIEIRDCGDYYLIKGFLPGVSSSDVRIDFQSNMVILTIRKNQVYRKDVGMMTTIIRTSGNIVKTFSVEEIDKEKIGASFGNNTLLLTLPKKKYIDGYNGDAPTIIDVDNYTES